MAFVHKGFLGGPFYCGALGGKFVAAISYVHFLPLRVMKFPAYSFEEIYLSNEITAVFIL